MNEEVRYTLPKNFYITSNIFRDGEEGEVEGDRVGYSASGVPSPECSAGWVSVLGTG